MFEGLDDIDWSSLTHAYGPSNDVPGLLRARASTDAAVVAETNDALFGNIIHQGTVYPVTAPAVPFLVNLLMNRRTLDRVSLVYLLAAIAGGSSRRPGLSGQTLDAVERGADDFWKLIDDPAVRIAIPYLLSKLPAETARICTNAPLLVGSNGEALFEASMLFCWAACEPPEPGRAAPFLTLLREGRTPLIRLGGALGVLRLGAPAGVEEAMGVYFEAFSDPSINAGVQERVAIYMESLGMTPPQKNEPSATQAPGDLGRQVGLLDAYFQNLSDPSLAGNEEERMQHLLENLSVPPPSEPPSAPAPGERKPLVEPSPYEPRHEQWGWGEGSIYTVLLDWVSQMSPVAREALLRWVPSHIAKLDDYAGPKLALEILPLAFDPEHLPENRAELNPLQFSALHALAQDTCTLYADPLIVGIQRALGLPPRDMKRLQAFLQ